MSRGRDRDRTQEREERRKKNVERKIRGDKTEDAYLFWNQTYVDWIEEAIKVEFGNEHGCEGAHLNTAGCHP